MNTLLWISLGAIAGANLRHFAILQVNRWLAGFPYGTLLVNVTGSLLLGFFLFWAQERNLMDERWRLLVAVGFCGGYTTFSTFAFETFALIEQGNWLLAAANVLISNLVCIGAVMLGAYAARSL